MMEVNGVKRILKFFIFLFLFLTLLYSQAAFACEGKSCKDLLVRFSDRADVNQISSILSDEDLNAVQFFPGTKIFHVEGNSSESYEHILKRLNENQKVAYAAPNLPISTSTSPNDPYYSYLWALHNIGQDGGTIGDDIGMESVWSVLTGSSDIIVAIVDTGIDYNHEDLAANMWINPGEIPNNNIDDDHNGYVDDYYGYNFYDYNNDPMDDFFHGTHVAGTIGAVGDNGIGVTGINWHVKLMAVKFLNSSGSGYLSDAIPAIEYAVDNGAKILNNSWGFNSGAPIPSDYTQEIYQPLRDAIKYADDHGVIFVAAAGNSGVDSDENANYPSAYSVQNIISVAATDRNDNLAYFSNWGKISVDLGAPGVDIWSSFPTWYANPPYASISGTSMATPHVAGAAAMVWANNTNLSHRQVINRILQGVSPNSDLANKSVTGGRLNLWQSILLNDPSLNHAPIAYAGPDQSKEVGDTISLSGSATDEDGNTNFSYSWSLTKPSGSSASLSNSDSASPHFKADVVGDFYATLVVSDGINDSTPSSVTIHVAEGSSKTPTVVISALSGNAGGSGEALVGSQVSLGEKIILDGTQSSTGLGNADVSASTSDTVTYQWSFIERPNGSNSTISDNNQPIAFFYPDQSGRYTVQLSVSNGKYTSTGELSFMALNNAGSGASDSSGGGSGGCTMTSNSQNDFSLLFYFLPFALLFIWKKRNHSHSY